MGSGALEMGSGSSNSAFGASALNNNFGDENVAVGASTLYFNSNGSSNVAVGTGSMWFNTNGNFNTAVGAGSLSGKSPTGFASNNTAIGYVALAGITDGNNNTASGYEALSTNSTGSNNTASGSSALYANTTGYSNVAYGYNALLSNTTGYFNTASGQAALKLNTTGTNNTADGYQAGSNITTGRNNIDIGNKGEATDGVATDSGVIRIGTQSPKALQTSTYIAGIYDNTSVTGLPVVIDSNGQLGTTSSSERFKTNITPMGSNTAKLQQLRPVTFQYKADPKGALRYGLIAEEVAKVYPELVVRDGKGRIDGVRYDELAPMLLNELQRQKSVIEAQAAEFRDMKRQLAEMRAALSKLHSTDERVAMR